MKMTKGRSMHSIASESRPCGHRNNSISFPTISVISFLGDDSCDRSNDSAAGLMDSRRCRATVTRETLTAVDTPAAGRISTRPSMRGSVAEMPGYPTCGTVHISYDVPSITRYGREMSHQEIAIRRTRDPHRGCHALLVVEAARTWAPSHMFCARQAPPFRSSRRTVCLPAGCGNGA